METPSGLIRVVSSDVSRDLLDFKIDVSFHDESDPNQALNTIVGTQVRTFSNEHNILLIPTMYVKLTGRKQNTFGRILKGQLHAVTVAKALDSVLQTFSGVWIYKECIDRNDKKMANISFDEPDDNN
ncbi:MAG: hypothetical protein M3O09_18535 [Acidobacteriota bacterium]|nr:hypothetical protein [Acidobacteriota bacterium]